VIPTLLEIGTSFTMEKILEYNPYIVPYVDEKKKEQKNYLFEIMKDKNDLEGRALI
jgi:hypothetical protein